MKILVVDDSPFYLSMVSKYLGEITGVSEVFLCSKPDEVIDIIDTKNIDIVIMDVVMPEISGFDLLKALRSDKRYDDMPIIMFTSLNDLENYKKCYELGATDFIGKPINIIEFNARLKVAIASKQSSNDYKELIEITRSQNLNLMEMNAKLSDTKFHLVQSEKMAAIGNLAAGIAHEINNPMGFVSSNFEILQKYFVRLLEYINFVKQACSEIDLSADSPYSRLAEQAADKYKQLKIGLILDELDGIISDSEDGVRRVTAIVQSLRTFARSVKDDEKDTYSLGDMINQVLLISKNEIKYVANVHLSIPDNIILYCNKVQIGQVFLNILVNAAQAIKSQKRDKMGMITIIAEKSDSDIAVHIIDDGPGIPEANLLKLFDPFFTTKEIGQGTGLGLSISYDIVVNKHGGSIEVETELGKGTEFIVKLPISSVDKMEE
jgi:signal transduction histidine kinase